MADKRRKLTADHFVAAAMEIAEERGLDGISMRELATRTGTTPMAAYHHVDDRENLIRLVVDRIGATIDFEPSDAAWDQRLRTWAHEIRRALRRYPGTARWLMTNPPAGPNALAILEEALSALVDAGLSDDRAAEAYGVLSTWVLTRCDIEDHDRTHSDEHGPTRRRSMLDTLGSGDGAAFPLATLFTPTFASMTPDDLFGAGLELILDGIRPRV